MNVYKLSYRDPESWDHWAVVLASSEDEAKELLRSWLPSSIPDFALIVEDVYPIEESRVIYASRPGPS